MEEYVIEVRNLTKTYGKLKALDDVSLRVPKGQIYGLVGKNGAGKTTLMRVLSNQTIGEQGEVTLFGENTPSGLNKMRRRTGTMIEIPSFYPFLSAKDNLEYYRCQRGIAGRECVDEVLAMVELSKVGNKKFKNFSLGMKQRLGLCQCLLTEVGFLILDEPFVGLDPIGKELFKQTILDMAHKQNVPVLFSSHDLDDVDEICDRVVMISKGNKQLDQPLEHKQTYTVKIECTISDDIKRSLMEKCGELSFFEDKIMFQDETLIIDIQKILLQKGHYICGFSVQKNNLKSLFGMEG